MAVFVHKGDLPATVQFAGSVAVDTETLGLHLHRNRLCVVQLSAGDGNAHLVQIPAPASPGGVHQAPHLHALIENPDVMKIFHYGRFDIAIMQRFLGATTNNVYCTKIASKMTRTWTERHGLKELVREFLGIDLSKQQQSSDWGADTLTDAQTAYAASDVLHLHALKRHLDKLLAREGRTQLAQACFDFLPTRTLLDLNAWEGEADIFLH